MSNREYILKHIPYKYAVYITLLYHKIYVNCKRKTKNC